MKHPVAKDQLGDFCPFHRCLNAEQVAKEGGKLELTGQFHHRSQETVLPELKRTHPELFRQIISADFKPADGVAMPDDTVGINLVKSNLQRRFMIFHRPLPHPLPSKGGDKGRSPEEKASTSRLIPRINFVRVDSCPTSTNWVTPS